MAHMEAQAKIHRRNRLLGAASKRAETAIAVFRAWRRSVAGRRALADMTPDQLRDIGCPDLARPTYFIRVGLITHLMSMR
ncbi:MAG: DUF1127 domain-containing protein [Mesorhizobium sp.]|nr:MAG: DUF1127 domain-containing protein [Mesorhizobium sp.]